MKSYDFLDQYTFLVVLLVKVKYEINEIKYHLKYLFVQYLDIFLHDVIIDA